MAAHRLSRGRKEGEADTQGTVARRRARRRALLLPVVLTLGAGLVVGRWLRVDREEVPLGLSRPLRVAVIGDLHVAAGGVGARLTKQAVAAALQARPDLILLVGDYVSGRRGLGHIRSALRGLQAPLGVYAVRGNHEHWTDAAAARRELEALGIRVLVNESVLLAQPGPRLALVGIDDTWAGAVDWRRAFAGVPQGVPVVLLSHNPDGALSPAAHRAALIVSGHTHGGLLGPARPLLRGIGRLTGHGLPPGTRYGRSHLDGLVREPWGWVYITGGVTPGLLLPRWFLRPEIGILEVS